MAAGVFSLDPLCSTHGAEPAMGHVLTHTLGISVHLIHRLGGSLGQLLCACTAEHCAYVSLARGLLRVKEVSMCSPWGEGARKRRSRVEEARQERCVDVPISDPVQPCRGGVTETWVCA